MMDAYKRETVVGFTYWNINLRYGRTKSKHKDAKMVIRSARRKNKNKLKKYLTT